MRKIAIIPARGGSKRIPRKNIKVFLKRPIIAYTIETALQSGLFEEVMVSTDDAEIAETAIKYGAEVPYLRSKQNADDHATLNDVLEEVINRYESNGDHYDIGCCLLATAPLISQKNLLSAYELLTSANFDSVRPVVKFSYPIQRAIRYLEGGKVEMFNNEYYNKRSQDLETAYHDAGQFYWFRTASLLRSLNRGAVIITEMEAQDIDDELDWALAEMKYKIVKGEEHL